MQKINMTGWIMKEHGIPDSRLIVLKEVESHITKGGNRIVQYLCQCECGNQVIVRGCNLRNGNTKSCGCIAREKIIQRNIETGRQISIGDRFGKLVVIKDLGMRKQNSRDKNWRWSLCQCDCGSEPIEVANNVLLNGHKRSCGCIGSYGELEIEQILKENDVKYKREFSFEDCKNPYTNVKFRFDFAVFEKDNSIKFLIEFDGRQHYSGPEGSWKNTRGLEEIQEADSLKNQYCIQNNIILKRIPYFELSQLSFDKIMGDDWNIK